MERDEYEILADELAVLSHAWGNARWWHRRPIAYAIACKVWFRMPLIYSALLHHKAGMAALSRDT